MPPEGPIVPQRPAHPAPSSASSSRRRVLGLPSWTGLIGAVGLALIGVSADALPADAPAHSALTATTEPAAVVVPAVPAVPMAAAASAVSAAAAAPARAKPSSAKTSRASARSTLLVLGDRASRRPTPANTQAYARVVVSAHGWGRADHQCLVKLWNKESRWNHKAMNRSSGAYGIPQALPGRKMASAGRNWRTDAPTQIRWGLKYIASRYGTPCAAWRHSQAVNWY